MQQSYTDINADTIDKWVRNNWEWGIPVSHEVFERAATGDWYVLLTPTKPVPRDWFCNLRGAKVLGLASGGGQQMPIFTACGAQCTVLDYSAAQLENEKMVAEREGYSIETVQADMTKPLPFPDERFDLIFHPVSNCYVEDVRPVWRECFRVLKKGGILLSGLDNGINYVYDEGETRLTYTLPFNPLKDEQLYRDSIQNDWGIQFSHTLEEQIGGQLEAGLRLEAIYEDTNGSGNLHAHNIPAFFATKSVKP